MAASRETQGLGSIFTGKCGATSAVGVINLQLKHGQGGVCFPAFISQHGHKPDS